jgi:hypothetical protein
MRGFALMLFVGWAKRSVPTKASIGGHAIALPTLHQNSHFERSRVYTRGVWEFYC